MSGVSPKFSPPPPPPLTARRVGTPPPPAFGEGGGNTCWVEKGVGAGPGVQYSSEDARHCSVLYLCKYFVVRINDWRSECEK
jgi:hypothetical protein